MDNSQLIDIIIPAFKAQDFIYKTLSSIAMQTVAHRCKVTIINDADGFGYSSIVDYFNKILDIKEITLETNSGPGVARQFGIDNTNCPYIMFMDADDTFENAYALESMLKIAEKNKESSIIIFPFFEVQYSNDDLVYIKHPKNLIWVFAKLYNRNFIKKNNISFNDSRANEDVYFNTLIELCSVKTEEEPVFNDVPMYIWHYNENSITRKNDCEYTHNASLFGYVDNMIECITKAKQKSHIKKQVVNLKIIELMVNLYTQYISAIKNNPSVIEKLFKKHLEFYDKFYSIVEFLYSEATTYSYAKEFIKNRIDENDVIFGNLTFKQYIDKMKEELEKQEVTDD